MSPYESLNLRKSTLFNRGGKSEEDTFDFKKNCYAFSTTVRNSSLTFFFSTSQFSFNQNQKGFAVSRKKFFVPCFTHITSFKGIKPSKKVANLRQKFWRKQQQFFSKRSKNKTKKVFPPLRIFFT
eukprot:TRINITY_DN19170_c0_g1_i1.p2 TRINITY_DN19170_c0_g1~~TRINITY_DN19170_c0_g1_i1.p2  ORF type:complete len:125 (+),score=3.07 TRINITY_DN19170_c0_g1_i1:772-1146(+)